MPNKNKVCQLLHKLDTDEKEGQNAYDELLTLTIDNYPEQSILLEESQDDEFEHEKRIKKIRKELKCGD
jgi:hypothetical protein